MASYWIQPQRGSIRVECHHARKDEVDASASSVSDAIDGACLARQVKLQVQLVQMVKDLVGQVSDSPLNHLRRSTQGCTLI